MSRGVGPSRRNFLGGIGIGTASVLAAGGGYGVARATVTRTDQPASAPVGAEAVPFYGVQQSGVGTVQQARLMFAAFDMVPGTSVSDLKAMLTLWAAAAARMTAGEPAGPTHTPPAAPFSDTGEALDLPPSELTITVGFGPSLFEDAHHKDRFGLRSRKPAALVDIPKFTDEVEVIDPTRSHGDIAVQACANDPQVAFHAVRNLARLATGTATQRWSQLGFGRTSGTVVGQVTPRNLMGFKDGTNNISGDDQAEMDAFVWVGDETDQMWMHGGTYGVIRRIRMLIENWDQSPMSEQQNVFGRRRDNGAPLTGAHEHDKVDLAAQGATGPIILDNAHIRLAAPVTNAGQKILRRGYSFTDGIDPITGGHDAGLFFIAYQKDARKQFIPIQQRLTVQADALNEYIRHTTTGIYAFPPGLAGPGDYFGRALFE